MTASARAVWHANFAKHPIGASLALALAVVVGVAVLMFAFVVVAIAGLFAAVAWAALRLAPRRQARPAPRGQNGQVLEARRTAEGWVVEATRGG